MPPPKITTSHTESLFLSNTTNLSQKTLVLESLYYFIVLTTMMRIMMMTMMMMLLMIMMTMSVPSVVLRQMQHVSKLYKLVSCSRTLQNKREVNHILLP